MVACRQKIPGLFQHALRYQIEIWHFYTEGSTTCRFWVPIGSLWFGSQPKWVKLIFCNIGLMNQGSPFNSGTKIAICVLLDKSSVFCKSLILEFWRFCLRGLNYSKFSGLSSTCFDITICNLVYTCSRPCDISSSSFIAIGRIWPNLHKK